MNNYIYLDNSATTLTRYFAKDYYILGNANSPHNAGIQANQALNEARDRIAQILNTNSGKVLVGGVASQLVGNLMWRIKQM